jgi:CheY-like chemotaxis protein
MTADNDLAPALSFLVVDDDEDIRDVLSQMVRRLGHGVATANDGLEALEALQQQTYDVMILDISMPRLSGLGVARWLHDNPDVAPGMSTIVLSAWAGETRGVLQELGIGTVMQKPIRLQQMRELIAERAASTPIPDALAQRHH